MSETVTLAGWKTQVFEAVLGFLPFWLQMTVIGLVVLLLLVYWGITVQEKIAARRAARNGRPVPAPEPGAQRESGADHLGPYAPRQQVQPGQQGSGADYLGTYAQPSAGTATAPGPER